MKNLRISLGIAALAIGSFAAFSFAPANNVKFSTGIFYSNPDGSMGDPVGSQNTCDKKTQVICSQEYNLQTHQPTNNSSLITRGNRL